MIFKGMKFFSGKVKDEKKKDIAMVHNPYMKASEELKRSAEELKKATHKLQESFRQRQESMNRLVSVFNTITETRKRKSDQPEKAAKPKAVKKPQSKGAPSKVGETELFEIYREACINFVETDKAYYFKLLNHSDFLSAMYKRYMGNVRYYDHEFRKLKDPDQYCFNEVEAYVANVVVKTVNRIGRERFIKEGHQALYNELCSKLLPKSANQ